MQHAAMRIFDVLERAQTAREALLADGFDAADILVNIANDEGGPVESNFVVGNSPVESDDHTYERNYAASTQGAQCIVTVAAADAALAARADAILALHGARTIADPAAGAGGP